MGATEALAKFAVEMSAASLSPVVIGEARRHIIDCIGAALGGTTDPSAKIISGLAARWGGPAESTVWGTGAKVGAQNAALANGTLAHAIDYDDTDYSMPGHPCVCVLPAVFAMAERYGSSGRDALAAFVAGVEAEAKIGLMTGRDSWDVGWHTTSTTGVVGAAVAAGRLAGLDAQAMQNAIGIAVSQASGVRQNFGTMTKPLHAGHAAWSAIAAVDLAREGFTASPEAIEGDYGFCNLFGGVMDRDANMMAEALGRPFEFETSRVSIKAFPCCGSTHGAIGAALQAAGGLTPELVESVMVEVTYNAPLILIHHRPTEPLAAKFSMEYCVATALLRGGVTLKDFEESAINRPDVQALLRKVEYRVPDEWKKGVGTWNMANARIEVKLRDGTVRRGSNSIRKGDAITGPLTDEELKAKFLDCTSVTLPDREARHLFDTLGRFETLPDLKQLTALLSPSTSAKRSAA